MKILLKRNIGSNSSLPATVSAGEPVWFKDRLYVGSVGATAGGQSGAAAGDPILVVDPKTITLSTSAQTYITVGPDSYTLKLPSSDPYSSARTPASHDIDGDKHTGISVSNKANKDLLYYNGTNWVNGTFATIFGGTPITSHQTVTGANITLSTTAQTYLTVGNTTYTIKLPASATNHNQTITAKNGSATSVTTFGADAAVELVAGTNIGITTGTNSITIANTYSHPSYAALGPIGGISGTTLTIPSVSRDATGHVGGLGSSTIEFNTAPSSSNKVATMSDISHLTSAMVYKGTAAAPSSGSALSTSVTGTPVTGWVILMSSDATIVPSTATSGTKTTLLSYNIDSNGDTKLEKGDQLIFDGTVWKVINGEGNVTNSAPTITAGSSTASTIGTVDGTALTAKVSVTAGSATIASVSNNIVTLKAGVTQTGTSGTISNSTGSNITLHKIAMTGDYGDLTNTPSSIVNTITTTAGAHTAITSQSGNVSFKIPTSTSHLTNDSGFITSHQGIKSIISSTTAQTAPTNAVAIAGSGNITLHKVAWTGTYSDLIGTPTIPASANNATLTVKTSTNTTASALFSADATNNGVLFIKAGNKISTSNSTGTSNSTVTNTVTIDHATGATAGASKTSIGGVNGNTITVPIVSTDAYGHVSSLTSTTWTYSAPANPGSGSLQLKVGTSGSAVDSGFTANSSSPVALVFNDTASGAKFEVNSSTKVISITEIDGGTF